MNAVVKEMRAQIGVLAVPGELAPRAAADLVEAGVRAILNFTAATVGPLRGVTVKTVDLTLFLESLSFQLATGIPAEPDAKVPPRPVRSPLVAESVRG
jgi:redox-sensing transcriptional repressor